MGEWHEVKPRPYSPCANCEMGHCSVSQKTENGKLYTKFDDCHETCTTYKDFAKSGLRRAMGGGILADSCNYDPITIR